jgi:hypothetical protein
MNIEITLGASTLDSGHNCLTENAKERGIFSSLALNQWEAAKGARNLRW